MPHPAHAFCFMRTYVCESLRTPTSITARPGRFESSGAREESFSVSSVRTAAAMDFPSMSLPTDLLPESRAAAELGVAAEDMVNRLGEAATGRYDSIRDSASTRARCQHLLVSYQHLLVLVLVRFTGTMLTGMLTYAHRREEDVLRCEQACQCRGGTGSSDSCRRIPPAFGIVVALWRLARWVVIDAAFGDGRGGT